LFGSTPDAFVAGLTAVLLAIFAVLGWVVFRYMLGSPWVPLQLSGWFTLLVMVGVLAYSWATSPTGFKIERDNLAILRPVGAIEIPLRSIRSVRLVDGMLGLSMKSWPGGNSGLFGIYGTFTNKELGKFQMYGRRGSGAVVIDTDQGPIALMPSPDERAKLAQAIQERIGPPGKA
jgi:hypothetical protein